MPDIAPVNDEPAPPDVDTGTHQGDPDDSDLTQAPDYETSDPGVPQAAWADVLTGPMTLSGGAVGV